MKTATLIFTLFITIISYSQNIEANKPAIRKTETIEAKENNIALFAETKKNAESGNKFYQRALADMYYKGEGTQKDLKEAFYWYQKSATNGVVGAKANLGYMYYHGEGTLKSYKDAFYWIQEGLGFALDAKTLFYLGNMHFYGQGTEVNKKEAAHWIKKSYEAPFDNEFQARAQKFWEENKLWEYE